jgi:CubicO group peptidase (beta-lactamase class C family)
MTKTKCFLIISLFIITTVAGQTKHDKQITRSIDELMIKRAGKISPGCAVLVSKNGEIFYHKALGMADLELNVPANPNMVFRIGSITKQFTSVAILQLIEQGKLSLNDSIQSQLPLKTC